MTTRNGYLYLRRKGRDTWHFHPGCTTWARFSFDKGIIHSRTKPTTGELCNRCLYKAKAEGKRKAARA